MKTQTTPGGRPVRDHEDEPLCEHFRSAAEVLGRRWNPQIIRILLSGPIRFGHLRDAIPGISDRLLSERLKGLEAEGIVRREVTPRTPVRIEYSLTEKGADLTEAITSLAEWAERWAPEGPPAEARA